MMITDDLNHKLGQYITFSFHDKKHYPRKPFLADIDHKEVSKKTPEMTDDHMEKVARHLNAIFGGKTNGNNS
jgi:hypothetical protein